MPNEPRKKRENVLGQRIFDMPGARQVTRCASCGAELPVLGEPGQTCPKCGAALHSCKQCTHFDTSAHNECRQPIPERIAKKDAANTCSFFEQRVTVERETGSASSRPDDARAAFDRLFKK